MTFISSSNLKKAYQTFFYFLFFLHDLNFLEIVPLDICQGLVFLAIPMAPFSITLSGLTVPQTTRPPISVPLRSEDIGSRRCRSSILSGWSRSPVFQFALQQGGRMSHVVICGPSQTRDFGCQAKAGNREQPRGELRSRFVVTKTSECRDKALLGHFIHINSGRGMGGQPRPKGPLYRRTTTSNAAVLPSRTRRIASSNRHVLMNFFLIII